MTYVQAQMDAMNRGREEGIAIGEARGMEKGRSEGASLMARLAAILARDGKFDDISRAGIDEGFRNEKLKEYGLA